MDGMLYPISLVLIALLAFTFFQSNNTKMVVLALAIGIYIIYSHETGHTVTDFKNEMINSIDESANEFSKTHTNKSYDKSNQEGILKKKGE